ncbi:MAG: hypothetical protein L0Z53_08575, partial [Acidobacteriales bacterium]|nr:hypothetical protein [Terriglobales bacterium]
MVTPCRRQRGVSRWLIVVAVLLVVLIILLILWRRRGEHHDYSRMVVELVDLSGPSPKPLDAIETGDSLAIGFRDLSPRAPVQIYLRD